MITQEVWQVHDQVLLMILRKEFIKLNVNMDIIKKKCGICRIKYKDCECCLEYANVIDDLIEYHNNYQTTVHENLSDFPVHTNFLIMISISLFYCCEELFTHVNTCMIEKNSMKRHYLEKKIAVT